MKKLKKACIPLLKYLNKNYHPHVKVIVTGMSIELRTKIHQKILLEDFCSIPENLDYVKD